ncbi:MAG: hypothetical protein N2442_14525 [Spirochaetes bacterium]|nr:hypothetical protein [Spirochaetota bacterium]
MRRSGINPLKITNSPVFRERIFFLPKEGERGQDRVARSYLRNVWVLCDGASEGYDGGGWARDLSRCAVRFSSIQRAVRVARSNRSRQILSWEALDWAGIQARAKGSYSTLLRVRILHRTIQVEGVGDTVVFFLRGYTTLFGFPCMEAEFFHRDPILISNRLQDPIPPMPSITVHWRRERITSILLATDALAAFLVKIGEKERKNFLPLLHRETRGRIRKTLEEEMLTLRIGRDDLSFVWLELKRSTRQKNEHDQLKGTSE